jgi:hypothetical protein
MDQGGQKFHRKVTGKSEEVHVKSEEVHTLRDSFAPSD